MKKVIVRLALLCTMMCLLCGNALAAEIWDGSVAGSFAGGSGTEDDPYLIENGAQLALVNAYPEEHFRLTADIYLNDTTGWEDWTAENSPANVWSPLFAGHVFQGVLEGDGHFIYGLYVAKTGSDFAGLFGRTNGAEFRDLSISQSAVFGDARVGSLVGEASETTIQNCHSFGMVAGTVENIAGLVGHAYECSISNCTNSGPISGPVGVAGIAGLTFGGSLKNCFNTGSITGHNNYIGGIMGRSYSGAIIENCENRGNIFILGVETTSAYGVGGITGTIGDGAYLIDCRNYAEIQAEAFRIAGIAGENNGAQIINCQNSKPITGTHDVGGIIGIMYDGLVDSCENTGDISVTENNSVGGIVGSTEEGLIRNSSNTGNVSSPTQNCGGITGFLNSYSDGIFNCRNTGTITAPSSVGGICGNATSGSRFVNCLNIGTVTATRGYSNCGAIAGRDQGCTIIHSHALTSSSSEVDDAAKITEITEEALKSADFLKTLNNWVQTCQRPTTGYAFWGPDADGYPTPMGDVPAYIPVEGALTLHQPENGSAVLSADSAWTETEITVTVTADSGYTPYQVWYCAAEAPEELVYAEKNGKNTFVFSMPYGDTEVYATCLALPENPVWDGTVAEAFVGGDGTENNPYLIGNASQLALVKNYTNKNAYFRLIADIYLNDSDNWESWTAESGPANVWKPISYLNNSVFDGNGHTIYGLYTDGTKSCQGLFADLQFDACLKNLTIDKSKVFGTMEVGAFAGRNWAEIVNCTNRADVFAIGENCGGITGQSGSGSLLENCINYGEICTSSYSAGGIAGAAQGTIRDCANYGKVTSTMDIRMEGEGGPMQVGGIVGDIWSEALVTDCQNFGAISSRKAVGGIVGITAGNSTVHNCTNYGAITAAVSEKNTRSGEMAAGVTAGLLGGTVSDCINYGIVSGRKYVGGICAIQDYNGDKQDGLIVSCTNRGEVCATANNAGGIVGLLYPGGNTNTVEQCVNDGAVSVAVSDDGYYAGGIVGYVEIRDNGRAIIRNNINTGAVSGNRLCGGLVGQLWINDNQTGTGLVESCYNTGIVTGVKLTAGTVARICAKTVGGAVTVRNCYALVTAGAETVTKYDGNGTQTVTNVKALTAAQMGQAANFVGFDFDTVWYSAGDGSFPTLLLVKSSGQMGKALNFTAYQNGVVSVTADSTISQPIYALLVSYRDGKMIAMDMVQLDPGKNGTLILQDQGDTVKLFALSTDWIPFDTAEESI